MTDQNKFAQYDEMLTSILVNEKSILGFLSTIFNFLARRTDFYYIPKGPYENMGFPPGVAEELVVKVLRKCDPNNWKGDDIKNITDASEVNEIMCSTVAQEVEVIADEETDITEENTEPNILPETTVKSTEDVPVDNKKTGDSNTYVPPVIPTQKNSETYNGAETDKYSWSQTIMELGVTVKLPPDIKSSKDLKVTINSGDICVALRNGDVIIKDSLPYKIKAIDSFWSVSEGKLLIHLEKIQERWWDKLLNGEETIDLSKIDCSRPLYELPDDHIAKVREMQWNQEQKLKGLPTTDEIRNVEILKKAWNAEGSPFKGQQFNPNIFQNQGFKEQ